MKPPANPSHEGHALQADVAEFCATLRLELALLRAAFYRELRAQRRWFVGMSLVQGTIILVGVYAMLLHLRHLKP